MTPVGWLTRRAAEVPAGEDWLSERERFVLAGLVVAKRREDWLLGRWTAKAAVAASLGVAPEQVEILAAEDGAPEALVGGRAAGLGLSLSHRAGRALAVVGSEAAVGCDLELIEPRSEAFVADWLGPAEQALVQKADPADRPLVANLIWSAKEAAAKVRRAGLRLDMRAAEVQFDDGVAERLREGTAAGDGWRRFAVRWPDADPAGGWWRRDEEWVLTVAGAAGCEEVPLELATR